ncbi:MAG: hypothetical protein NC041_06400 [Bacteroides sp.]|nr:hypothetical protein [Prevotella sp.]MCM1406926.1 histidinol-phosphatase [Treponema brennaborense]MCM1470077.1 hypothetical protein [Bacteroides sp.]
MISNFHTHTKLCHHAQGSPQDYIEEAALGLYGEECGALGFSDHCPYPLAAAETWPNIRMSEKEAPLYIQWVRESAKTAPFPVYAGFECEWDKQYADWYRGMLLGELKADYLAFGPHWVRSGSEFLYVLEIQTKKQLHRYVDGVTEGIASGLFSFVAHPDIVLARWKEWTADIASCMEAIIDSAVACGIPLEINGLGMTRTPNSTARGIRYAYPVDEFWILAAAKGARIICNSDAHAPQDVLKNAANARQYARSLNLPVHEFLPVHQL